MYSIYEISLVIIGFIILLIYMRTTSKTSECDAEENFGNFTSNASTSPVVAFINSKSNSSNDANIKKILFIPKVFNNNAFYKDSDYKKISIMSIYELGDYVKNNNLLYFMDLLNQFTNSGCSQSDLKFVLNLYANNYITFKNIDGESEQSISKHLNLYIQVKDIFKSYINLLSTNNINMNTFNNSTSNIDTTLLNIIQQLPQITSMMDKIKKINVDKYTQSDTVTNNIIMLYKNLVCESTKFNTITSSTSRLLNLIKSYNESKKFNNSNILFWIPFYVQFNLSKSDIDLSNTLTSLNEVFTKIIFPKIFNYSLTLIDLMEQLLSKQKRQLMINAINFFIQYVSSYLYIYMNVVTGQAENSTLLELQKLESPVTNLYSIIMQA